MALDKQAAPSAGSPISTTWWYPSEVLAFERYGVYTFAGLVFMAVSPLLLTIAISALIFAIACSVVILACRTTDPNAFLRDMLKAAVRLGSFPAPDNDSFQP